jgi:hypothetical protein
MTTINWDNVDTHLNGDVYINDEFYGTETQLYDDIDAGKIKMIDNSKPDPETKHKGEQNESIEFVCRDWRQQKALD